MTDRKSLGGAALAYIGDAVLELLIREKLTEGGVTDTGKLSAEAQKLVCAPAQSERVELLLPLLSEEELCAFRLGRNHKSESKPKHASVAEYRRATGMESVFGWLYLGGETERIRELFGIAYENIE